MERRKGFKKGFTLVEMMIVVAIIAILAGVAIPTFMTHVRKTEGTEAVGLIKAIIDGQSAYSASHDGKFYISGTDLNATLRVLNVKLPSSNFHFEMQVFNDDAEQKNNTILVKASNIKGVQPYIYMVFPRENSGKVGSYSADIWEGTVHNIDFITNEAPYSDFTITGASGWAVEK